MKKVLITLLVLGLASAANAGLMFTVGGADAGSEVMVTDVLEISGVDPVPQGAELYLIGYDVAVTGGNVVYSGTLSSLMLVNEYAQFLGYPDGPALVADLPGFGLVGATDLAAITLADGRIPQAALTGLLVDGIALGGEAGRLDLLDAGTFEVLDSVTVIPEPMTIALLGLGGLFLRRRK